jgi:hypothetical protein
MQANEKQLPTKKDSLLGQTIEQRRFAFTLVWPAGATTC